MVSDMGSHILLVDDSREFVAFTKRLLEEQGYRVSAAYDGLEAVQVVPELQPDIIILDVMMPRLDGWATLRVLQEDETTAGIPVVMLTALQGPQYVSQGFDLGCTWFCSKPVANYEELFLVLRRVVLIGQEPQDAPDPGPVT
jgi:CheY-like chemotaxis protein